MNKIFLFISFYLIISSGVEAKIWRVNNNPGIPADFTTAQAAHDGAAAGDTLHFEPSTGNYGNLVMTKKLVIIGIGDYLNDNPNNQVGGLPASINNITVNAGADNSVIMITAGSILVNNAQEVVIQRSHITGTGNAFIIELRSAANTIISNCILKSGIGAYQGGSSNNVRIVNNIISGPINLTSGSYGLVLNNVIFGGFESRVHNSTYRSNIILGGVDLSGSLVENNLASGNFLPAGNGNQNNVDMSTVFVNHTVFIDKNFILKAASPAIGAGYGGIDAGAFGGSSPYKLAVQPNVPAIYKLVAPTVVSGGSITVTISTKSNK